jgi:hypothetical protein
MAGGRRDGEWGGSAERRNKQKEKQKKAKS